MVLGAAGAGLTAEIVAAQRLEAREHAFYGFPAKTEFRSAYRPGV
jgi:hypothetical protein